MGGVCASLTTLVATGTTLYPRWTWAATAAAASLTFCNASEAAAREEGRWGTAATLETMRGTEQRAAPGPGLRMGATTSRRGGGGRASARLGSSPLCRWGSRPSSAIRWCRTCCSCTHRPTPRQQGQVGAASVRLMLPRLQPGTPTTSSRVGEATRGAGRGALLGARRRRARLQAKDGRGRPWRRLQGVVLMPLGNAKLGRGRAASRRTPTGTRKRGSGAAQEEDRLHRQREEVCKRRISAR